jgi:protoheme IX farnesyltransferase
VRGRLGPGDLARLFKWPISALSALSAASGYLGFAREPSFGILHVCGAVLLLAFAGSALNQAAEHRRDGAMDRTRQRPIPAGKLSARAAVLVAVVIGVAGSVWLWASGGTLAALTGVAAVLWYTAVYTPLKRVTAFALLPGALIGAASPAIGWFAAGGPVGDGRVLGLCFFWFMWQVPHFSLLLARHSGEYRAAGFPTLTLSGSALARTTFVWIAATGVSALLIPVFGISESPWVGPSLAVAGAVLCVLAWTSLQRRAFARAFHTVNLYALVVLAAVVVDSLL